MKILLLGGTGDARTLALALINQHHDVIYSIAGIVRKTPLPCEVRSGGFSQGFNNGAEGMTHFIKERAIDTVIDATHPYAINISRNAVMATQQSSIPCWRYVRPPWQQTAEDKWIFFDEWEELLPQLTSATNPFFTIGRGVFEHLHHRLKHQRWIIRTAGEYSASEGTVLLREIGPYSLTNEVELFNYYEVDTLITKNSGGEAVAPKLVAARSLGLPVFVQNRPALAPSDQSYDDMSLLLEALSALSG